MPFEERSFGGLLAVKSIKRLDNCVGLLDPDLQAKLKLPQGLNEIHVCQASDDYYILRTTVNGLNEIEEFLRKWAKESRVVWRVNKTCPKRNAAGLKNIYWKEFRCQSSNLKIAKTTKNMHKKHTDCQAYMAITIKKITKRCRSRDLHLPRYPTIIKLNNNHNHLIEHQDYLKNCPVSYETKIKFLKMYQKGHTPLSALNLHRIDLRGEYGESIVFSEMDRSICPDNQWCYRLYSSFLANKEVIPEEETELQVTEDIEHSIASSQQEYNDTCDTPSQDDIEPKSPSFSNFTTDVLPQTSDKIRTKKPTEHVECCYIENIIYDEEPPVKIEYEEYSDNEYEQVIDLPDDKCTEEIVSLPSDLTEDQIKKYLTPFVKLMTAKLKAAPELFVPAIEVFNNRLKYFETDLDLSESLHKFS